MADLVRVSGIESVQAILKDAGPKLVRKGFRNTLQASINVIANQVRANTPVKTGTLQASVNTAVKVNQQAQGGSATSAF